MTEKQKQLIESIKDYYNQHGFISKLKFPGSTTISRYFGSWNKALSLAGIPTRERVTERVELTCKKCGASFTRPQSGVQPNNFCNKSCAASYNNRVPKRKKTVKQVCQNIVEKEKKTCIKCEAVLIGNQQKFCSRKCGNDVLQSYDVQKAKAESRKKEYVLRAGGCCSRCGYDDNLAALVFHHLDPSVKSFQLDARSLSNRTREKIESEFLKCILLCANCHSVEHHPHLNNWIDN
jgi:hypothetical protein